MSKIKVTQIQPLSGTVLYLTGTLSASAGLEFSNQTISGSTAILTTLTASKAYIDVLDVNQINSTTTTETTLEVVDKLVIAGSGSSGSAVNDGGYQIGGYSTTTYPAASMIFSGSGLKFNVTGATSPVMYLSGSGVAGIGTTAPSSQAGIATFLEIEDASSAGIVLDDTGGREWNIYSADSKLYHWNSSDGHVLTFWGKDVGIGTSTPATRFDIVDTRTNQFRLSYDTSNYTSFGVSSGGDFTITPSGGDVTITATVTASSGLCVTGSAKFNDEIEVGGAAEIDGTLTVTGVSTFSTAVTGSSGLCITGSAKFNDEIEVAGAAEFDGNVTLGNAATDVTTVTGQFTGSNGAYITGSVLVSGSVTLGEEASDVIMIVGQLTASNGIEVSMLNISNELTASSFQVNGTSSLDGAVIINETGNDVDFRVESDGNANMLFVDASHNRVGIGTSSPWTALDVDGHVSLSTQSDPGTQSGKISLYAKNISGVAELVVQDDAGNRTTLSQLNHQVLLEDHNAEAFKFQEGTTHYMVFSTENGAEKISTSKNFIFSGSISGSAGMEMTGSAKFSSGNDGAGTIVVRSGNASQYSKISMGTNANKVTIGVPGGTGTFFSDTAAGDLVLRVDDNNGKIHIGAGTSGGAGLIVTEHGGSDPRIGIGTASPNAALDVAGHVFPHSDDTYDLGSASYRWRNIYTGDLHLRNDRGDWTIVEEEDFLCVINNKTGKKYEMMLKPLDED